ncbi:hypothetical protein SARC_09906 [Sphaeroforma arctica JP610]|uniref:FAD-binding PCMH-type domain-containing protein n=1 Tax=Sphaeroforma arctica JP610 TaxID=667725 RepID=A0A0L0FLI2_9EUKA|nr:hypothetical protein SARC_09906 [Sphaeroforma arctica JP610]KNC77634.1 hypothetical protein SARC_09906 [Sphaeroforma arctica JP610]|eukprot:XP_014151536.1 hypothetical protein SARC_09906 [Sphaeroforma arctica JP610]
MSYRSIIVALTCYLHVSVAEPACDPASIAASQVVLQTSASEYDGARTQWASSMGSQSESDAMLKPSDVLFCQSEDEVLDTINFAHECDYKLSIRRGGHKYVRMELNSRNKFLTKSYGLGMDHVSNFRLATANGEILDVNATNHLDLYKAVFGGSPGSWTGIDGGTGPEQYLKAFTDIEAPFHNMSISLPAIFAIKFLTTDFDQGEFHFAEIVATEMDQPLLIPDYYTSMQLQNDSGTGPGSQMNRNTGMNSYPLRDMMIILVDWHFFLDEEASEGVKVTTANAWIQPEADSMWMVTDTSNAQEADIKDLWKRYYPNADWFEWLQDVKLRVDPYDLFHTDMTILVSEPRATGRRAKDIQP